MLARVECVGIGDISSIMGRGVHSNRHAIYNMTGYFEHFGLGRGFGFDTVHKVWGEVRGSIL